YTKEEVRAHARRHDLPVAEKKESQDICFVPDGKYQEFLAARGHAVNSPGDFVDHTGRVVGVHQGVWRYTVGQREGLGIALGYPAYVNRIDPEMNRVCVGPLEFLSSRGLEASGLNRLTGNFLQETIEAAVKIRYNQSVIAARVTFLGQARVAVFFAEPQKAVAPGQSVVFYDGDVVLGGALIDRAF
ncbi:MAG: aminomethyltransferase beta-barrel domain-containing protein, partial [Candidatus Omnitrophota bacterium]